MLNNKSQASIGIAILLTCAIIFLLFNAFKLPPQSGFIAILALPLFIIAFINTNFALIILIFAMLFSPQIGVGGIPGREIGIRIDDVFLIVIFLGWMAKIAIKKELGFLKNTPLNLPILTYILISIISTLAGILWRQARPFTSIFYFSKYLEYFLLFFLVSNNLKSLRQARVFIYSMILVALLTSIYAWIQHYLGVQRVAAPFQTKASEANIFGGYLLLMIMVITGLLLNLSSHKLRIYLAVSLFFGFFALLFTLSRGSWLGALPAFAVLAILTRKGKIILFLAFLFIILSSSFIIPRYVKERVQSTFVQEKEYTVFGRRFGVDESAAARIDSWKYGLRKLTKAPLLGYGVGSAVPIVDNQYVRVLIEVGLVGFIAFTWILLVLFRSAMLVLRQFREDNFAMGLTCGFIAGFVGLLFHCFSAETFIVIRIMEPFWFLTAIVMALPELIVNDREEAAEEIIPQSI